MKNSRNRRVRVPTIKTHSTTGLEFPQIKTHSTNWPAQVRPMMSTSRLEIQHEKNSIDELAGTRATDDVKLRVEIPQIKTQSTSLAGRRATNNVNLQVRVPARKNSLDERCQPLG